MNVKILAFGTSSDPIPDAEDYLNRNVTLVFDGELDSAVPYKYKENPAYWPMRHHADAESFLDSSSRTRRVPIG